MDAWLIGLIAMCAIGLGLITYGALADRAKHQRAVAEMLAPPQRVIPQFHPDAPSPHYLSDLQAHRPPAQSRATDLSGTERERLSLLIKDPATVSIDTGFASTDFITDAVAGWAVLVRPKILLCAEPVDTFRELIAIVERAALGHVPLIIIAPGFSDEVVGTLEVNKIQNSIPLLAVTASQDQSHQLAQAINATPVSRSDLQADYVPADQLGSCETWISTSRRSFVLPEH